MHRIANNSIENKRNMILVGTNPGVHIDAVNSTASKKAPIIITEQRSISQAIVNTAQFDWIIQQWDTICPNPSSPLQPLRSPPVQVGSSSLKSSKWFFELRKTSDYLSLFLCRDRNGVDDEEFRFHNPSVHCHFQLLSSDGTVVLEGDGTTATSNVVNRDISCAMQQLQVLWSDRVVDQGCEIVEFSEWRNFLYLRELFSEREKYMSDDLLQFHMEFKVIHFQSFETDKMADEAFQDCVQEALDDAKRICAQDLVDDIASMHLADQNSDFTLHCGVSTYPIHKPIIVGRCKKLYNYLMSLMAARQTRILQNTDPIMVNSATVSDIEPEILEGLLKFIYQGSVPEWTDVKKLIKLLEQGQQFELKGIQRSVFIRMLEALQVDNGTEIMAIAEANGADEDIMAFLNSFVERICCCSSLSTAEDQKSPSESLKGSDHVEENANVANE